jgi:hypothetical protein
MIAGRRSSVSLPDDPVSTFQPVARSRSFTTPGGLLAPLAFPDFALAAENLLG